MTLQDFLLPLENVKFHSKTFVQYADKKYKVLVSDKRIILYAQRGHLLKSDDIVSERIDRLQGIEYTEKGLIFRTARIYKLSLTVTNPSFMGMDVIILFWYLFLF